MLDGVNDLPGHARQLAALLDPRAFKVNLIPYNPTGAYGGSPRRGSSASARSLRGTGSPPRCVSLAGREIDAACGQLAATAGSSS